MKLLMISGSYPVMPDGIGDYCHNLLAHLRAADDGIELTLVTSNLRDHPAIDGVTVLPLVDRWTFSRIGLIRAAYHRLRPDIVHIQYPSSRYCRHLMPNLLPWLLRRWGCRRVVVTLHGFGLYTVLGKARLLLPCLSCDAIIAVSDHIRQATTRFSRILGVGRVVSRRLRDVIYVGTSIVPAPADAAQRERTRSELGIPPATAMIAYFGFVNDGKGVPELLHAAARCRESGAALKLLLLAGLDRNDAYQRRMIALITELDLRDEIIITGYLPGETIARYLQAADLAALPFNYGASTKRTTLLTALACGIPTVTTRDRYLPEFFQDGRNIVLVPPRDSAALHAALMRLITDTGLRAAIASQIPQLMSHFDWDKIAGQHLGIYRRLADQTVPTIAGNSVP